LPFFLFVQELIDEKNNMNVVKKTITLNDGRTIEIETGKLAKQADGSVVVKMGKTMLLATVTCAKEAKEDVDFMPLQVEYKEKYASAGRYPGGFMKREGRPSDSEILVSRLIDRALRPLFPDDFHAEVFVTVTLISAEKDIMPDALAGLAASSALAVSDVPFNGPISEVRVARVNGEFQVNPSFKDLANADIDIMVAASYDNIMMVEGEMKEVSETDMLEAIKVAHTEIKKHCKAQMELTEAVGKTQKRTYSHEINDDELRAAVQKFCYDKCYAIAKSGTAKHERTDAFEALKEEFIQTIPEEERDEKKVMVTRYYHAVEKEAMRNMILNEGLRLDGRKTTEIRPIWCEIDYLPAAHGSAIFTRGETQSLTTVTLGTKLDQKAVDDVLVQDTQQFVLHYNFPPFSTGEARPARSTSRREIGHGNLAYRALKAVVPTGEDNPYAVRVVSDILESNGSSSMATVCAGTLALMDTGIKISKPVSGIAMGLITDSKTKKYAVLSDILGDEDHLGDMDFKVTGTADGITATQMDIKVDGLPYEVLQQALEQAKQGRLHILGEMLKTISEPRAEFKPHVPRMEQMVIAKEFIGAVIGTGGKVIQEIQKVTNTVITITEEENIALVAVFGESKESIEQALQWVKGIATSPEVGQIYKGKIVSILDFGAFVEILPGREGMVHISELAWSRVNKVTDVLQVGEEVEVKLLEMDEKTGKLRLSIRALLEKPEGYIEPTPRPREARGGRRDDRRDDRRRDDRRDDRRRDDRRDDRRRDDRYDDRRRDDHRDDRRYDRGEEHRDRPADQHADNTPHEDSSKQE
jgi:polyribonucleotide nucleotidyltransferase